MIIVYKYLTSCSNCKDSAPKKKEIDPDFDLILNAEIKANKYPEIIEEYKKQ